MKKTFDLLCSSFLRFSVPALLAAAGLAAAHAEDVPKITPAKDIMGFNFGDDYSLSNYTQLSAS